MMFPGFGLAATLLNLRGKSTDEVAVAPKAEEDKAIKDDDPAYKPLRKKADRRPQHRVSKTSTSRSTRSSSLAGSRANTGGSTFSCDDE
jgi:hypothetical protein